MHGCGLPVAWSGTGAEAAVGEERLAAGGVGRIGQWTPPPSSRRTRGEEEVACCMVVPKPRPTHRSILLADEIEKPTEMGGRQKARPHPPIRTWFLGDGLSVARRKDSRRNWSCQRGEPTRRRKGAEERKGRRERGTEDLSLPSFIPSLPAFPLRSSAPLRLCVKMGRAGRPGTGDRDQGRASAARLSGRFRALRRRLPALDSRLPLRAFVPRWLVASP